MPSRRGFLARFSRVAAAGTLAGFPSEAVTAPGAGDARLSLDGRWQFCPDPTGGATSPSTGWAEVTVPHTWQITPETADYMGVAWYQRDFEARPEWAASTVRIEFEAVFHSATVWINGQEAGRHLGKGYTAFTFDITRLLRFGATNVLTVRVDNSFDEAMLPRGRSSDWAHDGGIYRPVNLLITPQVFIERVDVEALPKPDGAAATLEIAAVVRNASTRAWRGEVRFRVVDDETGLTVLEPGAGAGADVAPGETRTIQVPPATLPHPKLWHFDDPHLYRLHAEIPGHVLAATFGVRRIEARSGGFYLNGERVRLMGVERMAGSSPQFGMAEPSAWLLHDHDDLKELNCVFTRVHWPQDRRVLDYCDRHGILIQTEVPAWGGATFQGMERKPSPEILENGLEQLREMIQRDRNHPCIFSWGLSNEINGQNPPSYEFVRRMNKEAQKLDPHRLRSYASNSLQKTPARDVAGLMDFIEWNEYYETWFRGSPADMERNLEEIHRAFPEKPIVVSEYGYCACTADRPEGDARRIEILRGHDAVFRRHDYVAGLIFFCYNDYRTHIGDKGRGVMKQRVHGVVDVFGARKSSFAELRRESSPVERIEVKGQPDSFEVGVHARRNLPAYPLAGYRVRGVLYGPEEIPLEQVEARLPTLAPGEAAAVPLRFRQKQALRVQFDVIRPTGFSALAEVWKP